VRYEHRRGLPVLRVTGELTSSTAGAFAECARQSLGAAASLVRVDLSGLTSVDAAGGLALVSVLEAVFPGRPAPVDFCRPQVRAVLEQLGLRLDRIPARVGAAPEDETARLVDLVREARQHASRARHRADRTLARVSQTTVKVADTRHRTTRIQEQQRRIAASRAAQARAVRPRTRVTRPGPSFPEAAAERRSVRFPPTLSRAIAFIDEHAGQELSVADIAAASSVTVRAVQLAFRRHLDMTPVEYLRQVRLDRARQDLITAEPARDSVTAVAFRWKFASASRFAAYYRRTFGVPPSHTLRS
jgi:AraC-like DNA-binding protein/anti-anti-sigma regulatory factor